MSHRAVDSPPDPGHAQAGFVLLEAVVAVALIAIAVTATLAAAASAIHATAGSLSAATLSSTAQNVLTDLRATTVYDPDQLASLAGRSVTFTAMEPGPAGSPVPVTIRVIVASSAAADSYTGSVTARALHGGEVTVTRALAQEAPAPGTVLWASPLSTAPTATNVTATVTPIAL